MPSKSWWNVNAGTSGRTVLGKSEAPSDIPMMSEWTTTPSSSTFEATDHQQTIRYDATPDSIATLCFVSICLIFDD